MVICIQLCPAFSDDLGHMPVSGVLGRFCGSMWRTWWAKVLELMSSGNVFYAALTFSQALRCPLLSREGLRKDG